MSSSSLKKISKFRVIFKHTEYSVWQKFLKNTTCYSKISGIWGDVFLEVWYEESETPRVYLFSPKDPYLQILEIRQSYFNIKDIEPDWAVYEFSRDEWSMERLQFFLDSHTTPQRAQYHPHGWWRPHCCCSCRMHPKSTYEDFTVEDFVENGKESELLNHHFWVGSEFVLAALLYTNPEWGRRHAHRLNTPYETTPSMLYEDLYHTNYNNLLKLDECQNLESIQHVFVVDDDRTVQ